MDEKPVKDYIAVGRIVNTHGIKGELKVMPATSDMSRFDYLTFASVEMEGKIKEYRVTGVRHHKDFVLVRLKGVDNMTDAELLKGRELLVDRENAKVLEEGEYFIFDLLGLEVFEDEKHLGKLTDVLETGSNDVYVIKSEDGEEILIPALKTVVVAVDMDKRIMKVRLPEGLLDEI